MNFDIDHSYQFNVAKVSGIYAIINTVTKKFYIGESLDIKRRWSEHKRNLKNGTHDNLILTNDYKKYGEAAFEYKLIQPHFSKTSFSTKLELLILEDAHIKKYREEGYQLYNIENTLEDFLQCKLNYEKSEDVHFNKIMRFQLVDLLLKSDVKWIEGLPCIVSSRTIDGYIATGKYTSRRTDNMIKKLPEDFIDKYVSIKSIEYSYKGETKVKRVIIVLDEEPVLEWLKSKKYKVYDTFPEEYIFAR